MPHPVSFKSSQRFLKAEGLRNFLSFVVERTLAGRSEELKESVIAMDAFHRRASFDPRLDAFVRVQAGRLRTASRPLRTLIDSAS